MEFLNIKKKEMRPGTVNNTSSQQQIGIKLTKKPMESTLGKYNLFRSNKNSKHTSLNSLEHSDKDYPLTKGSKYH